MSVIENRGDNFPACIRANHPLRSLKYQRGDVVDLVYSSDRCPSMLMEFKKSTFIKCYLRQGVDVVVFIHDGIQQVLPLHSVGVVGVDNARLK
jgi:hypothetical protein